MRRAEIEGVKLQVCLIIGGLVLGGLVLWTVIEKSPESTFIVLVGPVSVGAIALGMLMLNDPKPRR